MTNELRPASRTKIVIAFAAVYLIWGSTYLAIRFAVQTLPPFLMAAARFLASGLFLFVFSKMRSPARASFSQWRAATIIGALLLLGGNGAVVWSEQHVPSGLVALIVAVLPFWIVILEWVNPPHIRPSLGTVAGVIVGIIGLVILVGPNALGGGAPVRPVYALILVLASLSWAIGSLYAKHVHLPPPLMATGMEMLAGGALLLLLSFVMGEPAHFHLSQVSLPSLLGLLYLTTFGSLLGFTAFIWLLGVAPAARVATYAYVNPVVAVFLGWAIAGEPLTARTLFAAAIIIGAVALITTARSSSEVAAA
jgi:drug/metabolite transporter (DMT)-like permease